MKKLLIAAMLLTSEFCFGQKDTSGIGIGFTARIQKGIYFSVDSTTQATDTISCVMIVSDTSLQFYNNSDCINCPRKGYDNFTYWQKGYEVRNKSWICCDPYDNWSAKYYWFYAHIKYLDEDKKPLK